MVRSPKAATGARIGRVTPATDDQRRDGTRRGVPERVRALCRRRNIVGSPQLRMMVAIRYKLNKKSEIAENLWVQIFGLFWIWGITVTGN